MPSKYVVIADELRRLCIQMQQSGKKRFPTEAELCIQYNCSRQTVRHALDLLQQEGLLNRRHGSGTYLNEFLRPDNDRIALITTRSEEYIYPRLIRELSSFLSSASYRPELYTTENQVSREREILLQLLKDPPAAILIEGTRTALPNPNIPLLLQFEKAGVPIVFLFAAYPELKEYPCIRQDDAGGGELLTCYFLQKKHRHIAAILKSDDLQGLERYRGYLSALYQNGAPFRETNVLWYNTEDITSLLNNQNDILDPFIRNHLSPCTAVLCYNDEIAYHLIRCLQRQNCRVPEDIAVLSFDNSYYCSLGPVPISSLGHERQELTQAAADAVIQAAEGKQPDSRLLSWIFTERESS